MKRVKTYRHSSRERSALLKRRVHFSLPKWRWSLKKQTLMSWRLEECSNNGRIPCRARRRSMKPRSLHLIRKQTTRRANEKPSLGSWKRSWRSWYMRWRIKLPQTWSLVTLPLASLPTVVTLLRPTILTASKTLQPGRLTGGRHLSKSQVMMEAWCCVL